MLALRDWLDAGGLAGLLVDRTLPKQDEAGAPQRGNTVSIDFPGKEAMFNDAPFHRRACAARCSSWLACTPAARATTFSEPRRLYPARPGTPAEREAAIRAALVAYVARLEALCREYPYNWFNFHDFWLEDKA